MNNTTICVDASLVITYVISPDHISVQKIWESWDQEKVQLIAPSLIFYEVTNVLHRYQRQNWLNKETSDAALKAALSLPIDLVYDLNLHVQAKVIAHHYQLPAAYDAHYLAIAEQIGVEFWTADSRLANTLHHQGVEWVHLIES